MTGFPTTDSTRAHAQILPGAAPIVRPPNHASTAFAAMLAERSAWEQAEPGREVSASDAEDPARAPDGPAGEQGEEVRDTQAHSSEANAAHDQAGDADENGLAKPVEAPPRPETHIEGVIRELTHAASVDLAALAGKEMVKAKPPPEHDRPPLTRDGYGCLTAAGDSDGGRAGGSDKPGAPSDADSTDRNARTVTARQQHTRTESVRSEQAVSPGVLSSRAVPRADSAVVDAVASKTDQAKTQTDAAFTRVVLLERLGESAQTRRGAITAVDRIVSGPGVRPEGTTPASGGPVPLGKAVIPSDTVLAPVQRGLAAMLNQGGGKMTVVLRPEQLGEVRLVMHAKDGVVSVRLEATTETARRTLENGLSDLRAALEARGVRVESLSVDIPYQLSTDNGGQGHAISADSGGGDRGLDRDRGSHNSGTPGYAAELRTGEPGDEPAAAGHTGIWTELGIDAVA